MDDSEPEYWIYHERQQAMLCGQHSLNNLVQANIFSPNQLAEIAMQLDQMELNVMAQNNEGGVRYVWQILYLLALHCSAGDGDCHLFCPISNLTVVVVVITRRSLSCRTIARKIIESTGGRLYQCRWVGKLLHRSPAVGFEEHL